MLRPISRNAMFWFKRAPKPHVLTHL